MRLLFAQIVLMFFVTSSGHPSNSQRPWVSLWFGRGETCKVASFGAPAQSVPERWHKKAQLVSHSICATLRTPWGHPTGLMAALIPCDELSGTLSSLEPGLPGSAAWFGLLPLSDWFPGACVLNDP